MTAPEHPIPEYTLQQGALALLLEAAPALGVALARAEAAALKLRDAARPADALAYAEACAALGAALLSVAAVADTAVADAAAADTAAADTAPTESALGESGPALAAPACAREEDPDDLPTAPVGARALSPTEGRVETADREGLFDPIPFEATSTPRALDAPTEAAAIDAGPAAASGGPAAAAPTTQPVSAPAGSPPVDVTKASAALTSRWARKDQPRAPRTAIAAPPPAPRLQELLDGLGAPPDLDAPGAPAAELKRLQQAVDTADDWARLPAPQHHALMQALAPRVRALQVQGGAQAAPVNALFSALSTRASAQRTGYVYGLARAHEPRQGSWRADSAQAWGEVQQRAAAAEAAMAKPAARRKAKATVPQPTAVGQAPRPEAAPDPAVQAYCSGKRALLVGAERMGDDIIEGLRVGLGLGRLDWESGKKPRTADGKVKAIRDGEYPLVIVLKQFMSHRVTNAVGPACDASATPIAWVNRGYGVAQVVAAVAKLANAAARPAR